MIRHRCGDNIVNIVAKLAEKINSKTGDVYGRVRPLPPPFTLGLAMIP